MIRRSRKNNWLYWRSHDFRQIYKKWSVWRGWV